MEANRQMLGLDENDTSQDEKIMTMSKEKVFANFCQWNGLLGSWYNEILEAVSNIYKVKL